MDSHILAVAAVSKELSALVKRAEMLSVSSVGGREIILGHIQDRPVKFLITGPGIVNTVQALSAAIEDSRPSLIILTGCAGAFRQAGINIGDIGIATEEIDAHLGIEPENTESLLKELPFSLIKSNNIDIKNRYPIDGKIVNTAFNALKKTCMSNKIGLKKGPFITVSTITATDKRAQEFYDQYKACMENMEGSGAAHLAIHYDIPFLEIRSASNIVGKRDKSLWNIPLSCERAAQTVYELICNLPFKQIAKKG